ncbi:hypothetical protein BH11PLA2_BH11PLA2_39350 [soil metagenome]
MRTLLLLILLVSPLAAQTTYRVGTASQVITPQQPTWMAGYANRKEPAKGKQHDLFVKAVAIEDSDKHRVVLLTSDLCGIPRNLASDVTAAVMKRTGLPREAIMLTCSHTHSGPVVRENLMDMYDMPAAAREAVTAYYPVLRDAMIETIVKAMADLQPAILDIGSGKTDFAMNRRQSGAKGVTIGKNPDGPVNHTVPVLRITNAKGEVRAVIFGYACHNTTLSGLEWSGDYAGYAQANIEATYPGALALFWIGCGADANPMPRGTTELTKEHGKKLADAVSATLKTPMQRLTKPVTAKYEEIALDYDALPPREQLTTDSTSTNFALKTRANRFLNQIAAGMPLDANYAHYPVQAWRFGDELQWLALGGEVVVDYALRLKKETKGTLWVTGYANDVMAYIPSERVLKEGGYEADSSMIYYGLPSKWKPGLEEKIVAAAKRVLNDGDKPLTNGEAKTPAEEKATFQLAPGFRIDLVASEPNVIDPVAMCFAADGSIYVCEMIGYPNGGVATGIEKRGRIRKLMDKDGDGIYETAVTFAEGLRFPTGICCWRDGVIVCNAPDITFLRDTDNDGKADVTKVLYTGFDLRNIQTLPNGLLFHTDGFVHAMVGLNGGTITCPDKPDMPPLVLRGRGLRFDPDTPGRIEAVSGSGQYGLTHDGQGHWFTSTNSQHLRQIVIPDHALQRNPYFAATAVTADIAEHGAAAKVFRISPFEAWRLERTARRMDDPTMAKRLPATEQVPGGFFTSACSPLFYRGTQFDPRTVFVGEPANNLIHRERLDDTAGPLYRAKRIDEGKEFLASTDNWFRPVFIAQGFDDAIYVCDFYREAIETPLSLTEDMKKRMNLESRQRGRIWRIAKSDNPPHKQSVGKAGDDKELFDALLGANTVQRDIAFRLAYEHMNKASLENALKDYQLPRRGRGYLSLEVSQLKALKGLMSEDDLESEMMLSRDDDSIVASLLILAEPFIKTGKGSRLHAAARYWLLRGSPRVRFQAMLSLGADPSLSFVKEEVSFLAKHLADPWFAMAAMTALRDLTPQMLRRFYDEPAMPLTFLKQLGSLYAAKNKVALGDVPKMLFEQAAENPRAMSMLDGLAAGLVSSGGSLEKFWITNPAAKDAAAAVFTKSEAIVVDEKTAVVKRVQAVRLLELAPFEQRAKLAAAILVPTQPLEVQTAYVQSLASSSDATVAPLLLAAWPKATPGVRGALEEALMARPDRITALLKAVEAKSIAASELGALRIDQLRNHKTKAIRDKAVKLLATAVNADRQKVIDDYKTVLDLTADKVRGKALFAKNCAACHKLENVGNDVGANLIAALPNKTKAALLIDILDPSREVDPRYVNYTVTTASGRTVSGILALETATSITLRRAEKAEDVILRSDLESITASKKSLMPEDLEKLLGKQDLADVLAYLMSVGR